jgi:hypothetical protein
MKATMTDPSAAAGLEEQIDLWRSYLRRRQAIHAVDVEELEDHLREQVAGLVAAGLDADEAFLVAVKRMGSLDALSREFAREHSERLWKQLVVVGPEGEEPRSRSLMDARVAFWLAVAAGLLVKLPALFGIGMEEDPGFYLLNLSFFVLPLLAGYFAWKRRLGLRALRWIVPAFVTAGLVVNLYPFAPVQDGGHTALLASLHLPIALWLVVGLAYAGARWRDVAGRMDFIRFSGELFVYYALIAFGGVVLILLTRLIFDAIGIDVGWFVGTWVMPCGALGAVLIASWLVEAKQTVVENMAPVLTRLFTPLFTIVLLAFLVALLLTGGGTAIDRDALIAFDFLLVLVLGLLLYSISARDPRAPPGFFDRLQVVLVVSALLADAVALWAIAARIGEFGASPNKLAALGENVVLLVNLAGSAVLYVRFLRRRGSFEALERWQTGYLPVYAVWAALVVLVFPLLFRFI